MNKLDTHNDKVPFYLISALRQVQETLRTNRQALGLGKELFAKVQIDQGVYGRDVQTEVSDGLETKETTRATDERRAVPPGDDKQCQADRREHEQSQINGTPFLLYHKMTNM